MKEIVVISGKGGTGKTSVVASFAALADGVVLADCDVDAADLHLILKPDVKQTHNFSGGKRASVIAEKCIGCGRCEEVCNFDAARFNGPANDVVDRTYKIDPVACEGCSVCVHFCPADAMKLEDAINGQWFVSDTRFGPMVHARLGIAEENSGKLVSLIRKQAKQIAAEQDKELVIVDGSPGIGCPVIASVSGADLVLVVTEPTISAQHDLERVIELTEHFKIPAAVCINKCDINPGIAKKIKKEVERKGLKFAGEVHYDVAVTKAQIAGKSIVEYSNNGLKSQIISLWETVLDLLNTKRIHNGGKSKMKIAIPVTNGKLSSHFGHCEQFAVIDADTEGKKIKDEQLLTPPLHQPGVLPQWLSELSVNLVIAGGMGQRAQQLFNQNDIDVIVGAPDNTPQELVMQYLAGQLRCGENICDH